MLIALNFLLCLDQSNLLWDILIFQGKLRTCPVYSCNGSALFDYGQALFELGELFTALEVNEQLLQRDDLPTDIKNAAISRGIRWRGLTRENFFRVSALAGYDNNLNSAPFTKQSGPDSVR